MRKVILLPAILVAVSLSFYYLKDSKEDTPSIEFNKALPKDNIAPTIEDINKTSTEVKLPEGVFRIDPDNPNDPNALPKERADKTDEAYQYMLTQRERDEVEKERQEYYRSITKSYSTDIYERYDIEESVFHDYKSKIHIESEIFVKDLYFNAVVKSPISVEDFIDVINNGIDRRENNNFSLELPYYSNKGDYLSLEISGCESTHITETVLHCGTDE